MKMIEVKNIEVLNMRNAIRAMRNPLDSWNSSDSCYTSEDISEYNIPSHEFVLGEKDKKLALKLIKSGTDHSKFMRMIFVSMDITAPLCWWHDFDTYKISTVKNSCSTMHKLGSRLLIKDDFSWDEFTIWRKSYLEYINSLIIKWQNDKSEHNFREMRHDLSGSFNQKATWTGNYQNLRSIYFGRKNHKQKEFRDFCDIIKTLPESNLIICE